MGREQVPSRTTVLIAGGGPAGLACAVELGQRGVECLVVEPRASISWDRPRAKTTSARSMEHFRRWGLADRIRAVAPLPVAWSDEAVFCTAVLGREITRIGGCFALAADRQEAFAESGQQIPQPLVEEVLRDAARALAPVTLLTGRRVVALTEHAAGVEVQVAGGDGERDVVRADYVLGCEGSRSVARDAIGAVYAGTSNDLPNFNVVFRAPGLAERVPHGPAIHYWVVNPAAPGLVGRMDLDETWWAIAVGVDEAVGAGSPTRLVQALVGEEIEVEVLSTDPWTARMLLVDRYQSDRVLLVGDAAHLNPPWGGHGYNTAIGDACNLGWKLAAVQEGWAGPALLPSYEAERRPVAARTIAEAEANMLVPPSYFAHPGLGLDGPDGDAARRLIAERIQAEKRGEFHSLGLVLGYRYDDSPVVASEPEPPPEPAGGDYLPTARPGARLPHTWLPDGRSIYDVLGTGFTLLVTDDAADPSAFVTAARRRRMPLAVVGVAELGMAAILDAELVLVRPDQHIGWRGPADGANADSVVDLVRGAG